MIFSTKAQHTKPAMVKVATQTSYLLCPPLLQVLPTSGWHSSWHIFEHVSDILTQTFSLNFFQTYLLTFLTYFWPFFLTRSFWTSCRHIFWLILWHLATTSLTHSFCTYYQPFRSQLRSDTPHWTRMIAVEVRHATLNSRAPGWGPARHTQLTASQLGSGTPHWTHELAVGVRHATLNSRARSWGPRCHTEHTSSQLRSDTPHWTHKIVVEARQGGGGRGRGDGRGGEEETDIKSNNPHLTGGEKQVMLYIPFPKHPISLYICFVSMLSYSVWIQTVT